MRINNAATDGERTLNCSRGFNYNRTVSSVKDVPSQKLPNFDSSLEMNAIQITAMEVSRNNPEQETKADENLLDEPALSPPIKMEPMDQWKCLETIQSKKLKRMKTYWMSLRFHL